ncbi:transcription factor gata- hypothetical protein [Limosa lapponica baueri]|uniref:Uncharacterized protein n=1 Tax=Limosa lapponica baueri TaxID=1758121 RepID=A0A2I0TIB5_LIMLA|nr:transcription factor gata- hypothetical protein [Limosa lapponica baueri]
MEGKLSSSTRAPGAAPAAPCGRGGAQSQSDEALAGGHSEFKFEPEDYTFSPTTMAPQPGLSVPLRQDSWCALALA